MHDQGCPGDTYDNPPKRVLKIANFNREIKSYPSSNLAFTQKIIIVKVHFLNQGLVKSLGPSDAYMRQ